MNICIYIYISMSRNMVHRPIDWYIYESNPGGGGWGGPTTWFWVGLQFISGPLPRNFKHIRSSESSAQAQSIAPLFEQIG